MFRDKITPCRKCGGERHRHGKKGSIHCPVCISAYLKAWRHSHREQHAASNKAWKAANPERVYIKQREDKWKEQGINITFEEYQTKIVAQNNLCMICDKPANTPRKGLGVDHNHTTGQVRDLLCHRCNGLIRGLEDPLFPKFLAYLEKWNNIP
jgi:uncharacterized Zn finger protein (UPF0148 family)